MNVSNIGICAGHYNGANRIPAQFATAPEYKAYSEGTAMYNLAGLICSRYPQIFNGRAEAGTAKPWRPDFPERARRLAAQKCDYAFELHTNWSLKNSKTPNRGVFLVITSLCYEDGRNREKRAREEVELATMLWKPLADELGLKFQIRQKKGGGNWDWYSFINFCKKRGIAHPMIIEHGYHMDYAGDAEEYARRITDYYEHVLAMVYGANPYAEPAGDLAKGAKGAGVRWMQWHLTRQGFALPKYGIDGIWGNETEAAYRAFQARNGLYVDGKLKAADRTVLEK